MQLLKTVANWTEAFDEADRLLSMGQLSAVALVSKAEYDRGTYVATYLSEHMDERTALGALRSAALLLYGQKSCIELFHGPMQYARPEGLINGWTLVMVYTG